MIGNYANVSPSEVVYKLVERFLSIGAVTTPGRRKELDQNCAINECAG